MATIAGMNILVDGEAQAPSQTYGGGVVSTQVIDNPRQLHLSERVLSSLSIRDYGRL